MSAATPCVPCCSTPQSVNIPGLEGLPGGDGVNGVSAFTTLTAQITTPNAAGNTITANVVNSSWMVVGMQVIIGQGLGAALVNPGPGIFQITAIASLTAITIKYLGYADVGTNQPIDANAVVAPYGGPVTTPLSIASGGTAATTAQGAANNLGARARLLAKLIAANFNVGGAGATGDQIITGLPTKYLITQIIVTNASVNMTTAAGGFYGAAAKNAPILVAAGQVYTALTVATKFVAVTLAGSGGPASDTGSATSIYFSLTTPQGAPATADIYIWGEDLT